MSTGSQAGAACPKCGRSRADGAAACPRCGLVFELWVDSARPAKDLDDKAQALFRELETRWSSESLHEAFLKHCASAGCLGAAGQKYRQRLDRDPGDATAARMQARIVSMAAAVLAPLKSGPVSKTSGRWFWWVVAIAAVAGALAGLFFGKLGR